MQHQLSIFAIRDNHSNLDILKQTYHKIAVRDAYEFIMIKSEKQCYFIKYKIVDDVRVTRVQYSTIFHIRKRIQLHDYFALII